MKVGDAYLAHEEAETQVEGPCEVVFDYLDDPLRLGSHMRRRGWQTMGMRMEYVLDAQRGKGVGARIGLRGTLFGLRLEVEEVVVESTPPTGKTWTTVGVPRLLVIAAYRMGYRLAPREASRSTLNVFIDYTPVSMAVPWLSSAYARWCVRRIASDAREHFAGATA